jgi:hypothetical protein
MPQLQEVSARSRVRVPLVEARDDTGEINLVDSLGEMEAMSLDEFNEAVGDLAVTMAMSNAEDLLEIAAL